MRTFEQRVYTLRTREALDFYVDEIYPRHLGSFPLFGIEPHGFWTVREDVEPRLFVLVSYPEGAEPGELVRRYMQGTEFAEDIRNFDVSNITGVSSTILLPTAHLFNEEISRRGPNNLSFRNIEHRSPSCPIR